MNNVNAKNKIGKGECSVVMIRIVQEVALYGSNVSKTLCLQIMVLEEGGKRKEARKGRGWNVI
jgi:hypothetical protein